MGRTALFILCHLFVLQAIAQSDDAAKQMFKSENYLGAMKMYQGLLKQDPTNVDYNYKIAYCYLHTHVDKTKAIPFLEFVTKQDKFESYALYELGLAYQLAYKLDEAIDAYTRYKTKVPKDKALADRQIETCNNAKDLIKKPVNVTFENLGKDVNSPFADYYPFIPADESFIAFTSRRKGGKSIIDFDGHYTSDIYLSEVKKGEWQKAKNAGPLLNTAEDEEVVGMPSRGHSLMIYIDHRDAFGDIYFSDFEKLVFQTPQPFGLEVNTKNLETAAAVTSDGNKLFFASDKPGGFGGTDIYESNKLPNGEWGAAFNLGPTVNTKYNEDFPHLSDDNVTLYFASQGHNSMGGFDIFKSHFDSTSNKWLKPDNIGYPINTTDDDMTFCASGTEHDGYISAIRPEGYGDYDIYKVIFNDVDQRHTLVTAKIVAGEPVQPYLEANIQIKHNSTQKTIGKYKPKNFGHVVFILPPGKYVVSITLEGYKKLEEELIILDKSDFVEMISKTYNLEKIPSAETPVIDTTPKETPVLDSGVHK